MQYLKNYDRCEYKIVNIETWQEEIPAEWENENVKLLESNEYPIPTNYIKI